MTKQEWKRKIVRQCKAAGTYKPFFVSAIETLSSIMEQRDLSQEAFEEGGSKPVVIHVNKAGEANPTKNPALLMILDCNAQALAYWRELGLTSKSWQAMMKEERLNGEKKDTLEDALTKLGI